MTSTATGASVLVVEDDPPVRSLVRSLVEGRGDRCLVAVDLTTARRMLIAPGGHFDPEDLGVFLDSCRPVLGLEVLETEMWMTTALEASRSQRDVSPSSASAWSSRCR